MARFSVVVPAYDAAATLAETLDALLVQRCTDWDCVVVDDGSDDETLSVARDYAQRDTRISVVSQPNAGTGGAYNTGVMQARGDYVVLCSADDILLPEHLAQMSAFIEQNPGFDVYTTNGYLWTPESDARVLKYEPGTVRASWTLTDLISECFFSVGAAYRRALFDAVGGYRVEVFGEDYDFWLRAMATGARHRYLDEPLSLHRLSAEQKSANAIRAYHSDVRLLTDLQQRFDLSPEERAAIGHKVREIDATVANIRKELLLHRLRLLRGSDAPWLRPIRSIYRTLKRLGR